MIYFFVLSALIALSGLATAAAVTQTALSVLSLALFAFGVFFAVFLAKRHFNEVDAARHETYLIF